MNTEKLASMLQKLNGVCSSIDASAVVSATGLMLASDLPAHMDADKVAPLCSAMYAWGGKIARETAIGEVEGVYIKTGDSCVLMTDSEKSTVSVVLSQSPSACCELDSVWDLIDALNRATATVPA